MPVLDSTSLHASLGEPVLGSISFLNEVMSRFPAAISFAPGAPHLAFLPDIDIGACLERFLDHLRATRGPDRARRMLYEYGPSRGLINDLVADALRLDYGMDARPNDVVITVGAQEAMFLTLRALFSSPADILAVVNPCFAGITGAARLLDIDPLPVGEGTRGVDLDQLREACRGARRQRRRIRALYVAPDFSNPAGTRLDLATRHGLLELAEAEDLLLLEDNAYGFTAAPGTELPTLKALDHAGRVIYLGTFAKVCLPAARVGFVLADQPVRTPGGGHRSLADEIAALKSMVTVNTSPVCQALVGGMLLAYNGSLAELGRAKAEFYRRNLGLLLDALDRHLAPAARGPGQVTWNRPAGGFFVRMSLPVPADMALLELSAAKYGVLWTPMSQFHLDDSGANALRLSCSYLDPDQIDTGIGRLAGFLRSEVLPTRRE